MTAELLSSIAGIVLSLAFSYIPRLSTWYAGLSAEVKRLIMLGLLVVVAAAVYGLSCAGYVPDGYAVSCDEQGILALATALLTAMLANQATYLITPQTAAVRSAKSARASG